jgi:phosphoribosyl 1,2-cyclic phosphodiesterase
VHVQILGSGSRGNCALLRSGENHILLDAGLTIREIEARLDEMRVSPTRIEHIVLTHGHLDHARSAGGFAKKTKARVHCALGMMQNNSIKRAPSLCTLRIDSSSELLDEHGQSPVTLGTVRVPHDADPTVALRLEAAGRVLVTDIGRTDDQIAARLKGAHLLIMEFNHDAEMLRQGPYTPALKRRVAGPGGHLSNEQAAWMLRRMVGPELHTLVLSHLSAKNNTPELAVGAARAVLEDLGRTDVEIMIADQDCIGPNLRV